MNPIKMVVIPQGVPVEGTNPIQYMPLFTMEEVGKMSPEMQLEKIRAFHCAYGQYDILEKIDEDVEKSGNPYRRKTLKELFEEQSSVAEV